MPEGSVALLSLGGVSLVRRAAQLLADAGLERIVVVTSPRLCRAVADALGAGGALPGIIITDSAGGDPGGEVPGDDQAGPGAPPIAALLRRALAAVPDAQQVLVHDPLQPLVPGELVGEVLARFAGRAAADGVGGAAGCDLAVAVRPLTDTLKSVDAAGRVLGTADREAFWSVGDPTAATVAAVRAALPALADGEAAAGFPPGHGLELLPALVLAAGGRVRPVAATADLLRVADADDLLPAEHLLAMRSGGPPDPAMHSAGRSG